MGLRGCFSNIVGSKILVFLWFWKVWEGLGRSGRLIGRNSSDVRPDPTWLMVPSYGQNKLINMKSIYSDDSSKGEDCRWFFTKRESSSGPLRTLFFPLYNHGIPKSSVSRTGSMRKCIAFVLISQEFDSKKQKENGLDADVPPNRNGRTGSWINLLWLKEGRW